MKPAPFHYVSPQRVAEVVDLLATHGAEARLLAGGQSLVPLLARREQRPAWLIDMNKVADLDRIELQDGHLRMGALVRQEQARRCPLVQREAPGVAAALAWVANPVVRQRGTVIGNLMVNSPGAELPAVALALQASFVVVDAGGTHVRSAAELLSPGRRLGPDALVSHVLWPRRPASAGFFEVARREGHAPVVSALVSQSGEDCRVAVSGVCVSGLSCPTVARLIQAAHPLPPDPQSVAEALAADLQGPLHSDPYSGTQYRLEVAPAVLLKALQKMQALTGARSEAVAP